MHKFHQQVLIHILFLIIYETSLSVSDVCSFKFSLVGFNLAVFSPTVRRVSDEADEEDVFTSCSQTCLSDEPLCCSPVTNRAVTINERVNAV